MCVCVCVRACVYYMPYTFQIFSVCHSLLMSFASAASSAHIVFRSECKRRCLPSQWEWQRAYRCEGYLGVPAAKKMRKVPGKKNEGRHMPCITANMCQSHRAFQALSFREKYLSWTLNIKIIKSSGFCCSQPTTSVWHMVNPQGAKVPRSPHRWPHDSAAPTHSSATGPHSPGHRPTSARAVWPKSYSCTWDSGIEKDWTPCNHNVISQRPISQCDITMWYHNVMGHAITWITFTSGQYLAREKGK